MRPGFSLAELVAAMSIASLLSALLASTILTQIRAGDAIIRAAGTGEAITLASAVLATELREATEADVVAAADSLSLRAFRASAIVCDTADGSAIVRWTGARGPEPAKDSAIVLRRGSEVVVPVVAAATYSSSTCVARAGERVYRLEVGPFVRPGDLLLVFERGTYHLSGSALRWRAGAGGRQPLTASVIDDGSSGFEAGWPVILRLQTRRLHPRDHARTVVVPLRSLAPAGRP